MKHKIMERFYLISRKRVADQELTRMKYKKKEDNNYSPYDVYYKKAKGGRHIVAVVETDGLEQLKKILPELDNLEYNKAPFIKNSDDSICLTVLLFPYCGNDEETSDFVSLVGNSPHCNLGDFTFIKKETKIINIFPSFANKSLSMSLNPFAKKKREVSKKKIVTLNIVIIVLFLTILTFIFLIALKYSDFNF